MFTRNKKSVDSNNQAEVEKAAEAEQERPKQGTAGNGEAKTAGSRQPEEPEEVAAEAADADPNASETGFKERAELPPTAGADKIVRNHMYLAAGLGIIPIPVVDFVTTSLVALKMLRRLARYYQVPFRRKLAKAAIASLVSGAATPLAALGVSSLVKSVPIVGSAIGAVTSPLAAGAFTYATGQVFILHFGSGGTLFDFDPEKFRDYFQTQIKEGEAVQAQTVAADDSPVAAENRPAQ